MLARVVLFLSLALSLTANACFAESFCARGLERLSDSGKRKIGGLVLGLGLATGLYNLLPSTREKVPDIEITFSDLNGKAQGEIKDSNGTRTFELPHTAPADRMRASIYNNQVSNRKIAGHFDSEILDADQFGRFWDPEDEGYRREVLKLQIQLTDISKLIRTGKLSASDSVRLLPDLLEGNFALKHLKSREAQDDISTRFFYATADVIRSLPAPWELSPEKQAKYEMFHAVLRPYLDDYEAALRSDDINSARGLLPTIESLWDLQLEISGTVSLPSGVMRVPPLAHNARGSVKIVDPKYGYYEQEVQWVLR